MKTHAIFGVVAIIMATTFYQASNWWERAYATYIFSELSPDECIRVDTYEPFWVLPSIFHRIPDPDPTYRYALGMPWDAPIFKRAYEVSTGTLLGETIVFDGSSVANVIDWGNTTSVGRRVVMANQFPLLDSSRCSDKATLAKLEAYHERRREENQAMQETGKEAMQPSPGE